MPVTNPVVATLAVTVALAAWIRVCEVVVFAVELPKLAVDIPSVVLCEALAIVVVVCVAMVLIVALPIYKAVELAITLAPMETAIVLPVKIPVVKLIGSILAEDVLLAIFKIVELAIVLIVLLPISNFVNVNVAECVLF